VDQVELLLYAVRTFEQIKIPYALVGSFASGIWGETRFTQDIDFVIDLQHDQIEPLCAAFPADTFYVSRSAVEEAVLLRRPCNVIHPTSGNKIDLMVLGDTPWARAQIDRRRNVELSPNCIACVAAPEDVILGKLIYYHEGGSEKHLRDITGILKISGDSVDRDYIHRFVNQLDIADIWQAVLTRLESQEPNSVRPYLLPRPF